jgi:hypothetical protein
MPPLAPCAENRHPAMLVLIPEFVSPLTRGRESDWSFQGKTLPSCDR